MDSTARPGPLTGRVAIVTGAAGALGAAFARGLAAEGAAVVVADVDRDAGAAVAEDVTASGGSARFVHTDIASEESAQGCIEATVGEFGRIDILVNNAALLSEAFRRPFEEFSARDWSRMLEVNVTGTAMMMKAGLPHMRAAGRGSIVNVASSTVFNGTRNLAPYIASKGGVIALSRAAAREFGASGIRVNVVTPGLVDTRADRGDPSGAVVGQETSIAGRCIPRAEVPDDLVGAVVFLASDGSAFITGQTINVDGGFNLH